MPHIILEGSPNSIDALRNPDFFKGLHELLAIELPTDLNSCKSRLVCCEGFAVGASGQSADFLHVVLKILPGRGDGVIKNVAEKLLAYVQSFLEKRADARVCHVFLYPIQMKNRIFNCEISPPIRRFKKPCVACVLCAVFKA